MKRMVCLILIFILAAVSSYAHSGRTDAQGGHYNRKTGEYHYHSGGQDSDGGSEESETFEEDETFYDSDQNDYEDENHFYSYDKDYPEDSCRYSGEWLGFKRTFKAPDTFEKGLRKFKKKESDIYSKIERRGWGTKENVSKIIKERNEFQVFIAFICFPPNKSIPIVPIWLVDGRRVYCINEEAKKLTSDISRNKDYDAQKVYDLFKSDIEQIQKTGSGEVSIPMPKGN